MKLKLFLKLLLIITALLPLLYLVVMYDSLPQKVASHFDASGNADGFMTKSSFFFMLGGIVIFLSAMFVGLSIFLRKLPLSLLNVPNKDYWFSDERKEASFDITEKIFSLMGIATLLFFLLIIHLTIKYNVEVNPEQLSNFFIYLISYLVVIFSLVGFIYYHFRKPKGRL